MHKNSNTAASWKLPLEIELNIVTGIFEIFPILIKVNNEYMHIIIDEYIFLLKEKYKDIRINKSNKEKGIVSAKYIICKYVPLSKANKRNRVIKDRAKYNFFIVTLPPYS
ncbi:hypothetical protein [Francisella orientalis]|nr:hypothetical protein [Francisella orientalis]MBK2004577.1 hypothetical protein [Francisella orientalis]MBK2007679.1 hypothetical protein [Francisella orientalis]MBK2009695.1 hypothetical protein [Francisella orientalis]MBK2010501.1 hypothetical protein [Francisella orientalis]MBK2012283.1 hypothetical protein [Francisella orientalis]